MESTNVLTLAFADAALEAEYLRAEADVLVKQYRRENVFCIIAGNVAAWGGQMHVLCL
jgi:hypothetical protein